jgi:hypothetical protein
MRRAALPLVLALSCGGDPETDPPSAAWSEAFAAEDVGWLLSVWGPSPDELYAVGGEPGAGRMMRFDGAAWSEVPLPAGTPLLNWVFGFSSSLAYAVGEGGTILRYDGADWQTESTTVTEDLWGVWGASPDELWAVGGRGRAAGQATLLRRDAQGWRAVPVPELERPGVHAFFKVWGTGPDDVVVVGQRGAILRYDGATWSEEGAGLSEDLIALWGTGPDHVVAVGGRGNGVAAVWDGATWTGFQLAPTPGLNGVWTNADGSAWVAGEVGTLGRLDTATGAFTPTELPLEGIARQADFHALFGHDDGSLTAVGGNFSQPSGPFRGLAWWSRTEGREP